MSAGLPLFPALQYTSNGAGIRTDYGVLLPPGTRVTYVRSTGVQSGDTQDIAARLVTTLAQGLLECRAGMGDIVYVLPGHSETVTSTSFTGVVGARVIGLGDINRDDAPTFTWSSTGATWAISSKNMYFSGLRLLMDNANGVVAPINITASGCSFVSNFMRWSTDGTHLATTAITVGSGATDTFIGYNDIYGAAAGVCTDGIVLLGATVPSRTKIIGNNINAAAVAATGLIRVSVAALGVIIAENILNNVAAASIATISYANVACGGSCYNNKSTVLSTGAISAGVTGITVGGTTNVTGYFNNLVVNDPNKSGLLEPAADT